ncbi:hypothetical protein BZB76_0565 [Actinomadura pelletieri DSM 43383]|uniref:Uncharacterized protein n=1 Tax=Actinomadura pelletieri DSM 43383 TaxID=1120940 RepID=A0A495QY96_9ACTN|nr:hypothetical protein [Actinomadura pelletieri]RKS79123.1 hypothetical protein BZB76_0565 [Actinomadura pelletieri DSM 43383]
MVEAVGLGLDGWLLGLVTPPGVGLVVLLEKSTTARIQRWVALAASAMARTVNDFADASDTAEPGIRTIAVRSTASAPTSPRSHLTRSSERSRTHSDEYFNQDSGRSAVSRNATSLAVPPWARTRTV